jgi:peptidoglycan hydrolase-like protein with peptidoglycan-binding domain
MADEKLAAQLSKLKTTLLKWTELLDGFKAYALANDGVIDASEQAQIARIQGDIDAIKARILQIETKKGLNGPTNNDAAPEEATVTDLYKIAGSVGKGGKNDKTDVTLVQSLLNRHSAGLTVDGGYGGKTLAAIEKFQTTNLGEKTGLIEPGSPTFKALLAKPDKAVDGQEEINSGLGAKGKLGNTIIKKGDYIFSIPPNASGALPLLMLFSGLNQNASTLLGQVPDVYYLKAIMVFAGPKGKFTAAQSLYSAVLTMAIWQ